MYQNRLLDVEYIQEKLDEGFHYTEEAKGQNLVLVIGNTGVGKSTTCNYLLGHNMKEMKFNGRMVVETVTETNVKIGHEVKSETLYAKSIVVHDSTSITSEGRRDPICLLDCPGFLGNRTIEDKVIESISTELAVRCAKQIKGILILISLNILQETRVKELRELVQTLISLFKDPVEMVSYSIFIITKKYKFMPNEEARDITIGALSSLKHYCEQQATRLRENPNLVSSDELTCVDYDCMTTYFSAVLKRTCDILFINPLDNGESRELLLNRINGIKPRKGFLKGIAQVLGKGAGTQSEQTVRPITINDFSFSEGNEDRVKFNKALYDRARDGMNLMSSIQRCRESDGNLYIEISNCRERLSTLETLQVNLKHEISKAVEGKSNKIDFESIKTFELMITENDRHIKLKETEIKQAGYRKDELSEKLGEINNNDPLIFVEKSIYRYFAWYEVFGWTSMDFEADTGDTAVEIIKVEKEKENGSWKNENDDRPNGIYKISYESNYRARPAAASVKTYIKTKEEAGNKISIKKMKEDQHQLTEHQEMLKSEIESLKSKNQALQISVTRALNSKEDYKNSLEQKLKECENDMQRLNVDIVKMQEDRKEARLLGMTYLQEFNTKQSKFNIVVSIASLLEFPSTLIQNFVSQYTDFLQYVDDYTCSFDDNCIDDVPNAYERVRKTEEQIFSLKDPITGENIKDLVVTFTGTAFDEHSLLQQFDTCQDNPMPFVFTREDGSIEEIEFLGWKKVPDVQNYITGIRNEKLNPYQSSEISPVSLVESEINKLSIEQLQQQKDKLLKEIEKMKEEVEVKQTDLERVSRRLEKLQ